MVLSFFIRKTALALAVFTQNLLPAQPCLAQSVTIPVPKVTIYPRDIIRDDMLRDLPLDFPPLANAGIIDHRSGLIGKAARLTLLPGAPVGSSAVEEPRLVEIGRTVRLVFQENGITIVSSGQSLQAGFLGDNIRARNLDSGSTVAGVVQADGSLRVGQE